MAFRCLVLCSAALLVVGEAAASARELVVAANGDDKAAGTKAEPLRTIGKALVLAHPGDTVLVRAGVYAEGARFAKSGRKGKPITLKNYPDERPVIQPGEANKKSPANGILLEARAGRQKPIGWIVIEGLEIRYGYNGIKLYNAHDIVIHDCRIYDSWIQGLTGNGNRVVIDRNEIARNGMDPKSRDNHLHGIYATGSDFRITNNIIHSNRAYGIQVAAYPYKADAFAGKEFSGAKNWLISNNTLALNRHSGGMVIWMPAENCVVQNNIFYHNHGTNGILFYGQKGKRHPIRNNIFFPDPKDLPYPNLIADGQKDAYAAEGNQKTDPLFADAKKFDFRLTKGSPAIDKGISKGVPPVDFFGTERPQKEGIDIGAHEFKGPS